MTIDEAIVILRNTVKEQLTNKKRIPVGLYDIEHNKIYTGDIIQTVNFNRDIPNLVILLNYAAFYTIMQMRVPEILLVDGKVPTRFTVIGKKPYINPITADVKIILQLTKKEE